MIICSNCSNNFDTNYCPNCGTPARTKRIDKKYVLHEVQHGIFHFEKGFLYTVKELFVHPGHSIRSFIQGERSKHYKPIGFVIVTSIIYSILSHALHYKPDLKIPSGNISKIFDWVGENYNYSNLIEILFIAFTLNWFFRKKGYNYFENLVLLCYLTGFGMLIGVFCLIIAAITKLEIINSHIFTISIIIYTVWAVGQFYNNKYWWTYIKILIAYIVGFLLFMISAILLAVILNTLNIHL